MKACMIVVLSGYLDVWRRFLDAPFELHIPIIAVLSGQLSTWIMEHPKSVGPGYYHGIEPFNFARNANQGIRLAGDADVFLMNDDVSFTRDGDVARLSAIAHFDESIGILSPQFHGRVGNRMQERTMHLAGLAYSEKRLCFTGVYIKREVIDKVGLLDERFDGYGCEDDDYCLRVQRAGYKLAVTPEVVMQHGFEGVEHSASFRRLPSYPKSGVDPKMVKKFEEKWGRKP